MPKTYQPCQCHTQFMYYIDPENPEADVNIEDGEALGATPVYGACDRETLGTFAPGHDAKLKSLLQRLHAAGQEYAFVDGSLLIHTDPMGVARARGWERFLKQHHSIQESKNANKAEKAATKAKRAAERQTLRDSKANMRAAAKAEKKANSYTDRKGDHQIQPKAGFYPVRVKVGRWVYDGVIVMDRGPEEVEVEYTTGKGQTKMATVKRDAIVEGLPS